MDDFLKKLHQTGDISFGSLIEGKFIDSNDYSLAISSSEVAFKLWSSNPNRSNILMKISSGLKSKSPSFLEVTSLCSYKYRESVLSDIDYAVSSFEYFSKLSKKLDNLVNQGFSAKGIIGAAILDDCALFSMLSWVIAAPLAAGNTVVLLVKPSYSVIVLYFVSVLHELGLPEGVINVLPFIEYEAFAEIASHLPEVIGILPAHIKSSVEYHISTVLLKKQSFCPMLVLKSADIDSVIDTFINLTRNQDLIWFPNIIYVEEPIYDKFLLCLKYHFSKYNVGRKKFNESEIESRKNLNDFIDEKQGQGYEVLELIHRFSNCFVIVNNDLAVNTSIIVDEDKTNHHIVSLLPIRTEAEALSSLNSAPGLAASVWSNDAVDIIRIPAQLKYGTVWVNCAAMYCPSVPFSLWHTHGYGTLSGKRAFYENMTKSNLELLDNVQTSLYAADRNSIFSNKNISSVVSQSLSAQSSWNKLSKNKRLLVIENTAKSMDQNWNTHFKLILDKTPESVWKSAIKYMNFWSCYAFEDVFQQTVNTKQCQVICKSEPIGIIAIIAGSTPLDVLIFLIAAALVYGNSIIVGLSSDAESSITANELQSVFQEQPNLVSVLVSTSRSLWQQFIANKNISSLWLVKNFCDCPPESHSFKRIIAFESAKDMTQLADFFEIYVTKAKAIWLPGV